MVILKYFLSNYRHSTLHIIYLSSNCCLLLNSFSFINWASGQGTTKERGKPFQINRWKLKACLYSHETSRSLHFATKILKVYIEVLPGFSHRFNLVSTYLSLSRLCPWNSSWCGNCGRKVLSKGREWVRSLQLQDQACRSASSHFLITSSNKDWYLWVTIFIYYFTKIPHVSVLVTHTLLKSSKIFAKWWMTCSIFSYDN